MGLCISIVCVAPTGELTNLHIVTGILLIDFWQSGADMSGKCTL